MTTDWPPAPEQELIGRDEELSQLRAFVDNAAVGGGAYMLIGEAGVGKTSLLKATADYARALGTRTLATSGVQFEADISYAALNQVLLPLLGEIRSIPVPLGEALTVALGLGAGPAPSQLMVCNAALALLSEAAQHQPVMLVVDDIPWVDRSSAAILGFVARRLRGTRIGFLASFRTGEASFFERIGLDEVYVSPLSRDDAELLVRSRHPEMLPRVKQRLLEESAGNPLALLELAHGVASTPSLTEGQALPLTSRIESTFAFRIDELTAETKRALLTVALDGRDDLRELSKAGLLLTALAPAERAGLVTVDLGASTVRFLHPLMRSAVVQRSTSEEMREVHRTIANHLEGDPERQAWHLAAAAIEPDEAIASRLEAAGRRALQRGDASRAIAALTRAAQLSPNPHNEGRRLAEAAYLGADVTGELVNASKLLDEARRADPNLTASLHAAAAAAAAYMIVNGEGNVDTAFQLLLGAIETGDHGWREDNDELAEALSTLLLLCWWAGRDDYWALFYQTLGKVQPEPPELVLVQSRVFPDTARSQPVDREHLADLIRKQNEEFEPNRIIRVNTSSVYVDLLAGCRPSAWRLVEDGRHGGAVRSSLGAYMHLCLDDFSSGRWQEGQQLADEAISVCREHGYDFIIWYFLLHEALFAAGRGEISTALEWADELSRVAALRNAKGTERIGYHARTVAAVAAGDWESAYRYATQMSPAGELAAYTPHALWVTYDLVEAAIRTGRDDAARAHVQAMIDLDLAAISPRMRMLSLGTQALTAEGDTAMDLFEQAVTVPAVEAFPFDLAKIQLSYGERLRRNLNSVRAREVLHLALSAFERMGAVPWATRTKDELRAARDPNARTLVDAGTIQLTPQERAIAELAAEGMSNKQIAERLYLSPRTVSGHLYRVFPKLGITSRAALRDALLSVAGEGVSE